MTYWSVSCWSHVHLCRSISTGQGVVDFIHDTWTDPFHSWILQALVLLTFTISKTISSESSSLRPTQLLAKLHWITGKQPNSPTTKVSLAKNKISKVKALVLVVFMTSWTLALLKKYFDISIQRSKELESRKDMKRCTGFTYFSFLSLEGINWRKYLLAIKTEKALPQSFALEIVYVQCKAHSKQFRMDCEPASMQDSLDLDFFLAKCPHFLMEQLLYCNSCLLKECCQMLTKAFRILSTSSWILDYPMNFLLWHK